MDGPMQVVAVCKEYGLTYEEYLDTPQWFITLAREKMVIDQKEYELSLRKARYGKTN